MKAAIYARVSKQEGQDTENQLVELRRYAAAQGWEIVEYIDHATGKHSDREQFQRLFVDASQRKFTVVLVWALDRLSREGILATLQHLKRLKDYGVQFESFSEPQFRTTGPFGEIFGELMVALHAWMAKQERVRISERTKAGLAIARAKGKVGGRPAKVFDRRRAADLRKKGKSWRAIGRELGVPQSTLRLGLKTTKTGVQKTSPLQKKPLKANKGLTRA